MTTARTHNRTRRPMGLCQRIVNWLHNPLIGSLAILVTLSSGGLALYHEIVPGSSATKAQISQEWEWCARTQAVADVRIKSCTFIINSGKLDNANLALAFFNRGGAHYDEASGKKDDEYREYLKESANDYSSAIKLNGGSADFYQRRGYIYMLLGLNDDAISDFHTTLAIDRSYIEAFFNLSLVYGVKGDVITSQPDKFENYNQSLRWINKYISYNPNNSMAYHDRSVLEDKMGRHNDAENDRITEEKLKQN